MQLTYHPIANIFPLLDGDAYRGLVNDILANGQLEPIWTLNGQILDGRNRYRACLELDIAPVTRDYTGLTDDDSLLRFVVSLNLHRRHLNESQRMLIAARLATMKQGDNRFTIDTQNCVSISQPAAATLLNVSPRSVQSAAAVLRAVDDGVLPVEEVEAIQRGEKTVSGVLKQHQLNTKRNAHEAQAQAEPAKPIITQADAIKWITAQSPCDLLLTDPPYMTDVPDIAAFAHEWLPLALARVKPAGRAYVCIGAYPDELAVYLTTPRANMILAQVLVWTYRNTLGPTPRDDYKLNWQAILYFRGIDAPPLDTPTMLEQFSVMDINAPDGRMGDRYHTWQKPDELAERLIRHSTTPGAVVLDPFAGTGTFLLAATRLGRIATGCERDGAMIEIAQKRGCHVV